MKSRIPNNFEKTASMNNFIKEAQKMQEKVQAIKKETMDMEFRACSGGGAVEVIATGNKLIKTITLKPEIVDINDIEMLQDLIITAVNESVKKASDYYEEKIGNVTGNFNITGL